MNLVLADTEEFRRVKRKAAKTSAAPGASSSSAPLVESEEKRTLGLTIVRGAHIISLSVESPPPADPSSRLGASAPGGITTTLAAGAGIARPAGRGAPIGLAVSYSLYFLTWDLVLIDYRVLLLALAPLLHLVDSQVPLHLEEEVRYS
jgi:small nuclear ribonucleoprotein B and B'